MTTQNPANPNKLLYIDIKTDRDLKCFGNMPSNKLQHNYVLFNCTLNKQCNYYYSFTVIIILLTKVALWR